MGGGHTEKSYKFRLYPTSVQQILIHRTFGCCRFVYNHYLAKRKEAYADGKSTLNYVACSADMTALKQSLDWLKEVDATALQSSLRDLDVAYQNFFRGRKRGDDIGYPNFKSKHDRHRAYKSKAVGTNIRVLGKAVQLPKLGLVECRVSKQIEGRILSATVSQAPSGKYFVSICCTDVEIKPFPKTGAVVGIDLGLKDFAITSDGQKFENHKYLTKWGEFVRQLEYKAVWYGKGIVKIDRFYPSSQLCSNCGYQNKDTKNPSVRSWTCPVCGAVHDRDVNAAVNILSEGMRLLTA